MNKSYVIQDQIEAEIILTVSLNLLEQREIEKHNSNLIVIMRIYETSQVMVYNYLRIHLVES